MAISAGDMTHAVAIGQHGEEAGLLHAPGSREDIPIHVRLSRAHRSGIDQLGAIKLPAAGGGQVSLRKVTSTTQTANRPEHLPQGHAAGCLRDRRCRGRRGKPSLAILKMNQALDKLKTPQGYVITRYNSVQPESASRYAMKWDGEWHITIEVFRDLGMTFAAVLVLIYVLVVGWFKSLRTALVIMARSRSP
jgi:multidrug efflux pump subunit AcrB